MIECPINLPIDEITGNRPPDIDLAADYLELSAIFAHNRQSQSSNLIDIQELLAESEYLDVQEEIENRESVAAAAVERIASRHRALGNAYPFELDESGYIVSFIPEDPDLAQTAYLIALFLSNLSDVTELLGHPDIHPYETGR